MIIREMSTDDLDEVVAMETMEQPRPWTRSMFHQELKLSNRTYLVADDGGIVAFGGLMVIGEEGHITTLFVTGSRRRQGVGAGLLERLMSVALHAGARHLTLEVRSQNSSARALYSSLGFAPVGVRPNYYGDDDALIMWMHDVDEDAQLEKTS